MLKGTLKDPRNYCCLKNLIIVNNYFLHLVILSADLIYDILSLPACLIVCLIACRAQNRMPGSLLLHSIFTKTLQAGSKPQWGS